MAEVTIKIQDLPNDELKVDVEFEPKVDMSDVTMAQLLGAKLTQYAHALVEPEEVAFAD